MKLRDRLLWGLAISGGSRACYKDKLFLWTPPQYSKKKYRDLSNRMYRDGFIQKVIINGQMNFRLTGSGMKELFRLFPVLEIDQEEWDGFWRVIIFDIPESKRKNRDNLRKEILKQGFGRLQDSTYISPYEFSKSFMNFLQVKGLSGSVLLMEAKQKHLGNPKMLANKVWSLEEISKEYEVLIGKLSTRFGISDKRKREEFLKKIYSKYLDIVARDPFLPKSLLSKDWPADKAKKFVLRAGVVRE